MTRRPRLAVLLGVLAVLLPLGVVAAGAAGERALVVSSSPDRSSPTALEGATLSGAAYVFTTPDDGVQSVAFWVDDPTAGGSPDRTESTAPFDLAGGTVELAKPLDTRTLADGPHSVTAVLSTSTGTVTLTARFTVANGSGGSAPTQVHLAWTGDTSRTMTVVWRTSGTSTSSAASTVRWRPAGEATWRTTTGGRRATLSVGALRQATLTALTPGASYEYAVPGDGGSWSQVYAFRTAPLPGTPVDLVYFADTGLIGRTDGLASGTAAVRDAIAAQRPDLLLGGGDYAYYDTDKRYGSLEATIDAWFRQTEPAAAQAPLMPTYGNHEILLGEGFSAWAKRFPTPSGWNGRRAYSFDVAGVHVVSLFAVKGSSRLPAEHMTWLEQDLAAATAAGRPVLPFFHVSTFTDGSSHPSNIALRNQLGPLFEKHGVRTVLMSHDQSYNRTWPLRGVGTSAGWRATSTSRTCYTPEDGTTWLTVSPAGKESNISGSFSVFSSSTPSSWSAARDNTRHHWLHLRVDSAGHVDAQVHGLVPGQAPTVIDAFRYADSCP